MCRGGRADLALAVKSLHHTDTSGVDQKPLGQTPPRGGLRDQLKMIIQLNWGAQGDVCIPGEDICLGLTAKEVVVCLKTK